MTTNFSGPLAPVEPQAPRRSAMRSIPAMLLMVTLAIWVGFLFYSIADRPDDGLCATFSAYYDEHAAGAAGASAEWAKATELRAACLTAQE